MKVRASPPIQALDLRSVLQTVEKLRLFGGLCAAKGLAAIFNGLHAIENAESGKPRFPDSDLKKTKEGLFQHPAKAGLDAILGLDWGEITRKAVLCPSFRRGLCSNPKKIDTESPLRPEPPKT